MEHQIYLSRRNLLTLLSKLDRVAAGEESACTLEKRDSIHPVFPQTMDYCAVTAVEDKDYYADRKPGAVVPEDDPDLKKGNAE